MTAPDYHALTAPLRGRQARGERIVFTNGCFDLLHPGHVAVLERARALGDLLVVGLNDDDSVRRLKGPSRPLFPLAFRRAMLLALRAVDDVIPFTEDTPLALITALQPDILVKGGDYVPESVVGRDVVEGRGGQVVIVPLVGSWSTTSLFDRLREAQSPDSCG